MGKTGEIGEMAEMGETDKTGVIGREGGTGIDLEWLAPLKIVFLWIDKIKSN